MLGGNNRIDHGQQYWPNLADKAVAMTGGGRGKVLSAELSPDRSHLTCCVEIKTWAGLKVRYAGLLYAVQDESIVGRVSLGKRAEASWQREK